MIDKTLYKLNKRGKLQMWRIYTSGNQFFTEDWIQNGKVKAGKPTTAKPKNVGRANATTANEQAEAEAKAKITKKLNQGGYVEDAANASMYALYWEPMLAESTSKYEPVFPCWAQPKLDGGRCCFRDSNGGQTREGKDYFTIAHIEKKINKYVPGGYIVDGELYNHEYHDDFNKIMSLVKKQDPSDEEISEAEKKVQYWVYDLLTGEDDTDDESTRILRRNEWFRDNKLGLNVEIVNVQSTWVESTEELEKVHAVFLKAGFEGTMLRDPKGKYKRAGRSKQLLKKKDFIDDEFEIIDIARGKGNREGGAGAVICKTSGGLVFGAGIKGDESLRNELYSNKNSYIGRMATITFFGYTKKVGGVPRFPVYKGIRTTCDGSLI